jgi:hypothetical protein
VNLVDTIQQQLSGEVTKKLSSIAGIGEPVTQVLNQLKSKLEQLAG